MNSKLDKLYYSLEKQRIDLMDKLRSLPEYKFSHAPKGKWSISQILSHLIIAERMSLVYMKKKAMGMDTARPTGIIEDLKYNLLKVSQRLPLKYKAPEILGENDPPLMDFNDLEKQWTEVRKDLSTFLERFDEKSIQKPVYRHPVAGLLNVRQAVGFMREHVIHHLPQIQRLS